MPGLSFENIYVKNKHSNEGDSHYICHPIGFVNVD
jgi:hypothetical protein